MTKCTTMNSRETEFPCKTQRESTQSELAHGEHRRAGESFDAGRRTGKEDAAAATRQHTTRCGHTLEGIPSALRTEEIDKVLQCTRQDRRPVGLRDYAMLLLLSTYGLRGGEVVSLRRPSHSQGTVLVWPWPSASWLVAEGRMGNGTRIRKSWEHEKASWSLKYPAMHQSHNRFRRA